MAQINHTQSEDHLEADATEFKINIRNPYIRFDHDQVFVWNDVANDGNIISLESIYYIERDVPIFRQSRGIDLKLPTENTLSFANNTTSIQIYKNGENIK